MSFRSPPLIARTPKGLYCAAGDFYIDPSRAVDTAIVTHAHSDHARKGSRRYICNEASVGLMKSRLGHGISVEGVAYGKVFRLGEVVVSLHSAGHILGSAQVRVQKGSEVWVASGDYKRDRDPSCAPFEPVECDTFITEATFGTPKFKWEKNRDHGRDIHEWWKKNASDGFNSLLFGYSLGKAQRILAELAPHAGQPVWIHESIAEPSACYREQGIALAPTLVMNAAVDSTTKYFRGELFLAPPSILRTDWLKKLGRFKTAFASGWMQGGAGWGSVGPSYDHGFVMSDHADWNDLIRTVQQSRARRVFVQHRNGALVKHLKGLGLEAYSEDELEPTAYERIEPVNLQLL